VRYLSAIFVLTRPILKNERDDGVSATSNDGLHGVRPAVIKGAHMVHFEVVIAVSRNKWRGRFSEGANAFSVVQTFLGTCREP
jgi:hypothetical protein